MSASFLDDDLGTGGVGVVFTSASHDLGDQQDAAARRHALGRLASGLGVAVAVVRQVHGRAVLRVGEAELAEASGGLVDLGREADGLVTTVPGVALAIRVADCVPILLADEDAGVVGAAHAGRAGVEKRVLDAVAAQMGAAGATRLTAWVGPHVCGACYEVPREMADAFARATGVPPTTTRWGTSGIDLQAGVAAQLASLGAEVHAYDACTLTDPALHSYRRDGAASGRQAGLIWLRGGRATWGDADGHGSVLAKREREDTDG